MRAAMTKPSITRRALGKTGLHVSVLGFGASPLGGVFEDVPEDVAIASVHEAFKLGVNFFDTSPYYGLTKSEQVLGKALKALPRKEIVVATKVGRYGGDVFDFSGERVTASVHESLERLQLEYVDIVHCHDIEFGSLDQVVSETIPALLKLKEQGLVHHIGITGLPLKVYTTVLDQVPPGSIDVMLSYCHDSLNDNTLTSIIPFLQEKGVGIINASPLCMGLLRPAGPPSWHPAPPELREAADKAAKLCESLGVSLPKLALKHSLRNPDVASVFVGMAHPDVVRENVAATLEEFSGMPEEDKKREDEAMVKLKEIFAPVQGLTWPSGRPENN